MNENEKAKKNNEEAELDLEELENVTGGSLKGTSVVKQTSSKNSDINSRL